MIPPALLDIYIPQATPLAPPLHVGVRTVTLSNELLTASASVFAPNKRVPFVRVAATYRTALLRSLRWNEKKVASAITESGTITRAPFRDIGLDGSGEVVQVNW